MSSAPQPASFKGSRPAANFRNGAIALAVAAVAGFLWLHHDARSVTANAELTQIATKIAAIYTTSHTVDPDANMAFSAVPAAQAGSGLTYIQAGAFPAEAVQNHTTVANPWGGTIIVQSAKTVAPDDSFTVEFTSLPQAACVALLTANTAPKHVPMPDFYAVSASNANLANATGIAVPADGVNSSIAHNLCASTGFPSTNAVSFKFHLNH